MSKEKKEEVKEEKVVKEAKESEKVKAFKATWELFKKEQPKKWEEKMKNKEFDFQLAILEEREKEEAEVAKVLAARTTLSENPKK